jgi:hypothetical protein
MVSYKFQSLVIHRILNAAKPLKCKLERYESVVCRVDSKEFNQIQKVQIFLVTLQTFLTECAANKNFFGKTFFEKKKKKQTNTLI